MSQKFIHLAYTTSQPEAELCREKLGDYDIPIRYNYAYETSDLPSQDDIELLVPEDLIEEARYVLDEILRVNNDLIQQYIDFNEILEDDDINDDLEDLHTIPSDPWANLENINKFSDDETYDDQDDDEDQVDDEM